MTVCLKKLESLGYPSAKALLSYDHWFWRITSVWQINGYTACSYKSRQKTGNLKLVAHRVQHMNKLITDCIVCDLDLWTLTFKMMGDSGVDSLVGLTTKFVGNTFSYFVHKMRIDRQIELDWKVEPTLRQHYKFLIFHARLSSKWYSKV